MPNTVNNLQPSIAMAEFIAYYGIFPSASGSGGDPAGAYLGQVRTFAGVPTGNEGAGVFLAAGQYTPISQNSALFALLGTTFGGDGQSTFALPDLRGRISIDDGPAVYVGESSGAPSYALSQSNLPASLGGSAAAIPNQQPELGMNYAIRLVSDAAGGLHVAGEILQMATYGSYSIPAGYAACDGQILTIAGNAALYAAIGTTFGGDGVTTFALPDLRGRTIVGASSEHPLGQAFGQSSIQLTQSQLPVAMGGTGAPVDNYQPSLALNYMIATAGASDRFDADLPGIGEVVATAATVPPAGFLLCQGQVLNIADFPTLYLALGTLYGGNGTTTFALPDMRGRSVIGAGQGPGLPNYSYGQSVGTASIAVTTADIPALTVSGDSNDNALYGGDSGDTLIGYGGADTLRGNGGDDQLLGSDGTDTMYGGAGNDTYYVDVTTDVASEQTAPGVDDGGYDTVNSSATYALGAFIEVLSLSGTANVNGYGNNGNNVVLGNAGNNTLRGLGGHDRLFGGAGINRMFGGSGNDTYVVNKADDFASEQTVAGTDDGGIDTVEAAITYVLPTYIEKLNLVGSANINGTGNASDNTIIGTSGSNVLRGLGGHDSLDGGAGDDILFGGMGNDTYYVDSTGDATSEQTVAGTDDGGIDTVISSVSRTLGLYLENLTLTRTSPLTGTGNTLDNVITGNGSANTLKGLGGNDNLNGMAGIDRLYGGSGNDTYYVETVGDVVSEQSVAGTDDGGTDTVHSTYSYGLGLYLENLILDGTAAVNGFGNAQNNSVTGNSAANILKGLDGDDSLNGGAGGDVMYGGAGNDTYYVDSQSDLTSEQTAAGFDDGGTDTVVSLVTRTLGLYMENLTLGGSAATNGTGNALGNSLIGNNAANVLQGLGGNDSLNGRGGIDRMFGGAGDDTYYVDTVGDYASEQTVAGVDDGGSDTVNSTITLALGAFLEDLVLTGSAQINGFGNTEANRLTGNSAGNILRGMDGNDILIGRGGNDSLTGGSGGDTFLFRASDSAVAATVDVVTDLNFAQGDALKFVGFDGTTDQISDYADLVRYISTHTGASVTAGTVAGVARVTLRGDNGHNQVINLTDTSGNGTAIAQYQDAVANLNVISTGLPLGNSLTYYARFVDDKGAVIASDGNNGWVELQSFSEASTYVSLAFGGDRVSTGLQSAFFDSRQLGLEVEAYQTVNGQLQLIDQYLFANSMIVTTQQGQGESGAFQALSLQFHSRDHEHSARDGAGVLQAPTQFGWNYDTKSVTDLTSTASFVADGAVAGGKPMDLNYVVRFIDSAGHVIPSDGTNGWIELSGEEFTLLNDTAPGVEGGHLTFASDKVSTALKLALQSGASLRVEVEAYKTTTTGIVTVDEFLFGDAHVTFLAESHAPGVGNIEAVGFTFNALQQTHNTLDVNNAVTATAVSGWNAGGLSDLGDFGKGDAPGGVATPTLLVGRFVDSSGKVMASEGSNGWVALGEFVYTLDDNNFPTFGSPAPLLVTLGLMGADKVSVALEASQLSGADVSFQVESLALVGGQYVKVDEYLFSGVSGLGAYPSTNQTHFAFQADAFTHNTVSHDAKGGVSSTSTFGWDFTTKSPVTLTNPSDYLPASDQAVSHDENLTYVVRFLNSKGGVLASSDAGSTGWVAVSLMSTSLANGDNQLSLRLTDDAVNIALASAMLTGSTVGVDIEAYRTTASGLQRVDDFLYANAEISSIQSAIAGSTQITLAPGQYTHIHNAYDAKGVASQTSTGWDFSNGKAATLSDFGNYATGGVPAVAVDGPAALTYYARFTDAKGTPINSDGSGGWVALSSFSQRLLDLGSGPVGQVGVQFGDDRLIQSLTQAHILGTSNLRLEVDAFAGTQLVDQLLFNNVSVARQQGSADFGRFDVAYTQFQNTHFIDSKVSTSVGWNFSLGSSTTLTSLGAYNTSIDAGGGDAPDITYYMRLVDENGQTILADGGRAFVEIAGMAISTNPGVTNNLAVTLGSDNVLLESLEALLAGHPLAQIEIEAYVDSANGPRIIDEYLFGLSTVVTQFEASSPQSAVSVAFTQYQQAHYYDNGKGYSISTFGWDFVGGHTVSLGTPHADLFI